MSKRVRRTRSARVVREQLARERRRRRAAWISGGAALLLVVAGIVGFASYERDRPTVGFAAPAGSTADRAGVAVGSGPVTVEIYLDYLCPACREFETAAASTLDRLVADGRVTLVYRPVAILDRYSTNAYSSRSAAGAGCAADAGKLTEYTVALYRNQPAEGGAGHDDKRLTELAAAAGVPADAFGKCLSEARYVDWVTHTTAEMTRRGVRGTPTVYVGGNALRNPTPAALTAAVEAATPTKG
jgi:protein-disulfide isomerase